MLEQIRVTDRHTGNIKYANTFGVQNICYVSCITEHTFIQLGQVCALHSPHPHCYIKLPQIQHKMNNIFC